MTTISDLAIEETAVQAINQKEVYQCVDCITVYDATYGNQAQGIAANTAFEDLPADYLCSVCDGAKSDFKAIIMEVNKAVDFD